MGPKKESKSKGKGPAEQLSKKALAEKKQAKISDQTFGIKNKAKSAKAQKYVQRVKHAVVGKDEAARSAGQEAKRARRAQREAAEKEELALFSENIDVLGAKEAAPVESESSDSDSDMSDVEREARRERKLAEKPKTAAQLAAEAKRAVEDLYLAEDDDFDLDDLGDE